MPEPVLFAAPPLKASDEHMEGWLEEYNAALEAVDPETAAKEAASAEGVPSCFSLIHLSRAIQLLLDVHGIGSGNPTQQHLDCHFSGLYRE